MDPVLARLRQVGRGGGVRSAFHGTTLHSKLEARMARGLPPVFVASDIDHTWWLDARRDAARALHRRLARESIPLAYVTGRSFSDVQGLLRREGLPAPDMLASSVGTQRYLDLGSGLQLDAAFDRAIAAHGFQKAALRRELQPLLQGSGLEVSLQPQNEGPEESNKLSYYVTTQRGAGRQVAQLRDRVQAAVGRRARVILCEDIHPTEPGEQRFCVDLLPVTKEQSVADVAGVSPGARVLTAGDSGNDTQLLLGVPAPGLSVVVGGAKSELVSEVLKRTQPTGDRQVRKLVVQSMKGPVERLVYMGSHAGPDELGPDSILRGLELMGALRR